MSAPLHLAAIVFAWALYGVIHSWLAATGTKRRLCEHWPGLRPAYRLLYNLLAGVLALPPLVLTWLYPGDALWHWPAWIAWPAVLVTVVGFAWSMRWYDGMDFIGLKQLREPKSQSQGCERLVLSPMHRYVRHPWYALGLLYLWTRDLNAGWLAASLAVTLYLVIGSKLEERKLVEVFGEPYRRYLKRVPALVPMPGRHLTEAEAREMTQETAAENNEQS